MRLRAQSLLALAVLATGCLLTSCERGPRREVIDGVEHVFHPGSNKPAPIELTVELTIGQEFGEDCYFLGQIGAGVAIDDTGNVYVPDDKKRRVQVYTRTGEYLRTLGAHGTGPGEYQRPGAVIPTRQGEAAVADAESRKLVYFDSGGNHLRDVPMLPPSPGPPLRGFETSDGKMVGSFFRFERTDDGYRMGFTVEKIDPESGTSEVTYYEQLRKWQPRIDDWEDAFSHVAVDREDRVYRAPMSYEQFRIERYEPDGRLSLVIEKDYRRVKKTEAEIAEEVALREAQKMMTGGRDTEPKPFKPSISSLGIDLEGRVWAQLGEAKKREPAEFDVFTGDGDYVGRVVADRLPAGMTFDMFSIWGDKMLGADSDPADAVRLYVLSISG
jgi:hypothetical protein